MMASPQITWTKIITKAILKTILTNFQSKKDSSTKIKLNHPNSALPYFLLETMFYKNIWIKILPTNLVLTVGFINLRELNHEYNKSTDFETRRNENAQLLHKVYNVQCTDLLDQELLVKK